MSTEDPMVNPMASFNGTQWAIVEKLRAADSQTIHRLLLRIQALEGCLVYARNFLPLPLKGQAEAILWKQENTDSSISPSGIEDHGTTVHESLDH